MAKLDELIDELREDGREDDASELEKLRGSTLRKQAEAASKLQSELESVKAKLEAVEKAPKVRDAFTKYGVDLDSLSKLERRAVENYDGDLDEDAIAAFVEENELAVADGAGQEQEQEAPAAKKVAEAARSSAQGRGGKAPKVTPDEAAAWDAGKWMAFKTEHPEEAEALMRGEEVVGLTA